MAGEKSALARDAGRRRTHRVTAAVVLALAFFFGPGARLVAAQSVEQRLDSAMERLSEAQAANLDLISPRHFQRATERLVEARARYDQGGRIEDITRRIDEAYAELDQAAELQEIGGVLLREALEAREAALEAGAPEFASRDWERAEEMIREAGRNVEGNNQNGARQRAGQAAEQFRTAELNAIRADVLGRARTEAEGAREADANKRSPITFNEANALLARAEEALAGNRYDLGEASELAELAAEQYAHSALIALLADSVDAKRLTTEQVVLRNESELARVAEALGFEADFSRGFGPPADHALASIASLYEDRASLEANLAARSRDLSQLEGQLDSLDARLAELEQREAAVTAELRERQRRERRLREVRAVYTPEEAEVLLGEDRLIVRLVGLTFESGSDEIRPQNFSLLTKVQTVIREFPDADITVEGHTDAVGNEATNQALSRRRAIAVREYLLANMVLSADRITAVGYGESRPIAPNETPAGREKNRRIEVTLSLDEG